jgi:membrane associated rhomboid family serine protease
VLPLRDNIPTLRFPIVTLLLILINVLAFGYEITRPDTSLPNYSGGGSVSMSGFDRLTLEYGFSPCALVSDCHPAHEASIPDVLGGTDNVRVPSHSAFLTILTSMFMHGGWLHIAGNMLFLWIFGNNVEDAMGRFRFVLFYLLGGIVAALAQLASDPSSAGPLVGASGAIAGVLGGYIVLHPRARVLTAIILVVFFTVVEVPAWVLLGVYFFMLELLSGAVGLAGSTGDDVAHFAHVGGFITGLLLIRLFVHRRATADPPALAAPA